MRKDDGARAKDTPASARGNTERTKTGITDSRGALARTRVKQSSALSGAGPGKKPGRLKSFREKASIYAAFWQANAVLFLDSKLKRDPKISERLKHLRAQHRALQLFMKNPAWQKSAPEGFDPRMMGPVLDMMEKAVKQGSEMKMSELQEMSKNPQLAARQSARIRTRPGPPMKGRNRL